MECRKKENEKNCTCPGTDCPRHGVCCECVVYHREKGNVPMCLKGK